MTINTNERQSKPETYLPFTPVKLVDDMISRAFAEHASDIHFEPFIQECRVRMRVDGVLVVIAYYQKKNHEELIARLKVLSNLRTDVRLSPQDGRFRVSISNTSVNIRVSVIPSIHGEKCVLRLLPVTIQDHTLAQLGFSVADVNKISACLCISHGMILVVGPTGSGKTTTLYGLLQEKSPVDVSTVTLEDPVEYSIPNITQIPISTTMTFATALRSVVRQDPDVIMVGEIRDQITAELATHIALTGHLLFSTLHTNDAVTALLRLVDMGVEPFLIASTVRMIISQRLVRKICVKCKKEVAIAQSEIEYLGKSGIKLDSSTVKMCRGTGCKSCRNTGYSGRIVISEILTIDEKLKKLVMQKASAHDLQNIAIENGMTPLLQNAAQKVISGITTIEEVASVCHS